MNNNTVSIVLPVYNGSIYIDQCLQSLVSQTYNDLEIVIINDGSTDDSLNKLKHWESIDKRIKLYTQENMGLIKTLNKLIALSSGHYIARMDVDDYCDVTRIEKQVNEANKGYGLIGSDCFIVNDNNQVVGSFLYEKKHNAIKVDGFFRCQFCHPAVMFNLNIIDKTDICYDIDYPHAEDLALWFDLLSKYKSKNIKEKLVFVRRGQDTNVSSVHSDVQLDSMRKAIMFYLSNEISIDEINNLRQRDKITEFLLSSFSVLNKVKGLSRKYFFIRKSILIVLGSLYRKIT